MLSVSKQSSASSSADNYYEKVLKAARTAQQEKAQAASNAWQARQQAFAAELAHLISQEDRAELHTDN